MKTMVIDARQGGDWGMDLLFAGLVRNLGPENVVDYPHHDKHRSLPALTGHHEQDWGAERRAVGWTPETSRVASVLEFGANVLFKHGGIGRVFLDERDSSFELFARAGGRGTDARVVVVAGHDSFQNESLQKVYQRYGRQLEAMYVDNWRPEYGGLRRVRPYSWSANFNHFWDPARRAELLGEKRYDVYFTGYASHPDRVRFVDHVAKRWSGLKLKVNLERRPDEFSSFVPKRQYFEDIARSKLCLNLRGAAENGKTLRFYEIPYVGSCMLSQTASQGPYSHPFVSGVHFNTFYDERELDNLIEANLSFSGVRERTAREGHAHLMRYHTAEARVEQMLQELDGQG